VADFRAYLHRWSFPCHGRRVAWYIENTWRTRSSLALSLSLRALYVVCSKGGACFPQPLYGRGGIL
jgi:hypothetical protein